MAQLAFLNVRGANRRPIRMVGGWSQRTVVRKGGVSTEIVERWPDEIGPRGRAD